MPDIAQLEIRVTESGAQQAQQSLQALDQTHTSLTMKVIALNQAWELATRMYQQVVGPIRDVIRAAAELEQSQRTLQQSLLATGQYSDAYNTRLQQLANSLSQTTTAGAGTVRWIEQQMIAFGAAPKDVERLTKATLDLSEGMGKDTAGAAFVMGKAVSGQFTTLARYGVFVNQNATESQKLEQAITQIQSRFGGQAAASADTYAGRLEILSHAETKLYDEIGKIVTQSDPLNRGIERTTALVGDIADRVEHWVEQNRTVIDQDIDAVFKAILDTASALPDVLHAGAGMMEDLFSAASTAAPILRDILQDMGGLVRLLSSIPTPILEAGLVGWLMRGQIGNFTTGMMAAEAMGGVARQGYANTMQSRASTAGMNAELEASIGAAYGIPTGAAAQEAAAVAQAQASMAAAEVAAAGSALTLSGVLTKGASLLRAGLGYAAIVYAGTEAFIEALRLLGEESQRQADQAKRDGKLLGAGVPGSAQYGAGLESPGIDQQKERDKNEYLYGPDFVNKGERKENPNPLASPEAQDAARQAQEDFKWMKEAPEVYKQVTTFAEMENKYAENSAALQKTALETAQRRGEVGQQSIGIAEKLDAAERSRLNQEIAALELKKHDPAITDPVTGKANQAELNLIDAEIAGKQQEIAAIHGAEDARLKAGEDAIKGYAAQHAAQELIVEDANRILQLDQARHEPMSRIVADMERVASAQSGALRAQQQEIEQQMLLPNKTAGDIAVLWQEWLKVGDAIDHANEPLQTFLANAAAGVRDKVLTPLEKYQKELDELHTLSSTPSSLAPGEMGPPAPGLDADQASRGAIQAQDAFRSSMGLNKTMAYAVDQYHQIDLALEQNKISADEAAVAFQHVRDQMNGTGKAGESAMQKLSAATEAWGAKFDDIMVRGKGKFSDLVHSMAADMEKMLVHSTITSPILRSFQDLIDPKAAERHVSDSDIRGNMDGSGGSSGSGFLGINIKQVAGQEVPLSSTLASLFGIGSGGGHTSSTAPSLTGGMSDASGTQSIQSVGDTSIASSSSANPISQIATAGESAFSHMFAAAETGFSNLFNFATTGFGSLLMGLTSILTSVGQGLFQILFGGQGASFGDLLAGNLLSSVVGMAGGAAGDAIGGALNDMSIPQTTITDWGPQYYSPPTYSAHTGALVMHGGGQAGGDNLASDEVSAILQKGELVLPAKVATDLFAAARNRPAVRYHTGGVVGGDGADALSLGGPSTSVTQHFPMQLQVVAMDPRGSAEVLMQNEKLITDMYTKAINAGGQAARAVGRRR